MYLIENLQCYWNFLFITHKKMYAAVENRKKFEYFHEKKK